MSLEEIWALRAPPFRTAQEIDDSLRRQRDEWNDERQTRIYLDTNVFIHALKGAPILQIRCASFLICSRVAVGEE